MTEQREILAALANKFHLDTMYVFGSQCEKVLSFIRGESERPAVPPSSDVDIAVRPTPGYRPSVRDKARLAAELEMAEDEASAEDERERLYRDRIQRRRDPERADPATIPAENLESAAALSNMDRWAEPVALRALPQIDGIVTGSVAVTQGGRRCGKGEGYSDLEYALLRELGHDPVPVGTTVHPIQVVDQIPTDAHDLPLACVVTPDETIRVNDPPEPPSGIDWNALTDEDLEEMPVLRELE